MALIKGKQLSDGTITGVKLADAPNGVTSGKINDGAVVEAKIGTGAVTETKIGTGAVTEAKIGTGAVTTTKIADGALSADAAGRAKIATGFFDSTTVSSKFVDGSVAGAKLADGAVSTAKIADGALSADAAGRAKMAAGYFDSTTFGSKVADGAVAGAKLADGAVTETKIGTGAVTETKIGTGAVTEAKIGTGAVSSTKIQDNAVTTSKIASGALSADVNGRAKIADGFFDATTVGSKFAAGSIALSKLEEAVLQADGGQPLTGNLPAGGYRITGLGTPTADTDAATKGYVDAAIAGLDWKQSVRCATTGNITLSGLQTIDGVSVAAGDRVLVKNQTDQTQNGIYAADSGAWSRTPDADTGAELDGAAVFVEEGTTNADTAWVQTTDDPVIGTSNIVFAQFSGPGAYTAGAGLSLTGSQFDVELADDPGLEFDQGGAAGRLRAKVYANGGLQRDSNGLSLKLDGDSMSVGASGVKAAVPTKANKAGNPQTTNGDNQTTGLTITYTPAGDGMVNIFVNGIKYELGDGVKTKDCYFSNDNGATARAIGAITAGDTLYWNGNIAGFNLENGVDKVDMDYCVA